ncbi:MAG: hypothetical protein CMI27_01890 [Opitutae bacterium]|nr:hypothetical protein [Opitutae bacterium]
MGFEWPFSPYFLALIILALTGFLLFHARSLFQATISSLAWKLLGLRALSMFFLLFLLARPYMEVNEPDTNKLRLLTLVDLSGSMDSKDEKSGPRRIESVRPFFDWSNENSWLSKHRAKYGKIETLGFAKESSRLNQKSWKETEEGKKTALGNALIEGLSREVSDTPLGSVVVFSDGANNHGSPILEVAKEYRSNGIPVNVVGVGRAMTRGDVGVIFSDRKPTAVAKEELLLTSKVYNNFATVVNTTVRLRSGEEELEKIEVSLNPGEKKIVSFLPIIPKTAGSKRFILEVDTPMGDADPSNDSDFLLVMVSPPDQLSLLYLSSQIRPLYPFIKRILSKEERFDFNSLIQIGENVVHAFGERVKPKFPDDPNFWMTFDAMIIDLEALPELNASVVSSLKDYVQKRGGGLLVFGALGEARDTLGGLIPVKSLETVVAKENLSLRVLEEPFFSPDDEVEKMRPFLPKRLPGFFAQEENQGSRGVVVSRANGKAVLTVQAYGAGKVAYWGVPHDWQRALREEKGAKEFNKFWQSIMQWLGEGGEDRLKTTEFENVLVRGMEVPLRVEALGADFEPSMDAMIKAEVLGPDNYSQTIQLYPEGAVAGQYSGNFRPVFPGAYEIRYHLSFPDGENLESSDYLRVSELREESKNLSYAERELKMLANLTGGKFIPISKMNESWKPAFSKKIPMIQKRRGLADSWPIFIALFLAAGFEWVIRRQAGLK